MDLDSLVRECQAWKSRRKPHARWPRELLSRAADAARIHGVGKVARLCGITHSSIKYELDRRAPVPLSITKIQVNKPRAVSLSLRIGNAILRLHDLEPKTLEASAVLARRLLP